MNMTIIQYEDFIKVQEKYFIKEKIREEKIEFREKRFKKLLDINGTNNK